MKQISKPELQKRLNHFFNILQIITILGIVFSIFKIVDFTQVGITSGASLVDLWVGKNIIPLDGGGYLYKTSFSFPVLIIDILLIGGLVTAGVTGGNKKCPHLGRVIGTIIAGICVTASGVMLFLVKDLFICSQDPNGALMVAYKLGSLEIKTCVLAYISGVLFVLAGLGYLPFAYFMHKYKGDITL